MATIIITEYVPNVQLDVNHALLLRNVPHVIQHFYSMMNNNVNQDVLMVNILAMEHVILVINHVLHVQATVFAQLVQMALS